MYCALATQTVRMHKPGNMRIRVDGSLGRGVTAKDLGLYILCDGVSMPVMPLQSIEGPAPPLLIDNIDTDVIIRIERLASLANNALGPMPSRLCDTTQEESHGRISC